MGLGGDGLTSLGEERVDPQLVGLVVASLVRVGRAARIDELVQASKTLDATALDRGTARRALAWLEHALLVEEIGQGEWQLTHQLGEAFSPRGATRLPTDLELAEVLAWAEETRGTTGALEAVAALSGAKEGLPERIRSAADQLRRLEAPMALRPPYGLRAAFEALEGAYPESYEIYRSRKLSSGNCPTLQELADQYGVSRERIRQREAQIEQFILDAFRSSRQSAIDPIGLAARRIRAEFGPVARVDERGAMSALVDPQRSAFLLERPDRIALLLRFAGEYETHDEWLVTPDLAAVTDAALLSLTEEGHTSLEQACRAMAELEIRQELQRDWIGSRQGFRVVGGALVRWGRSLADKAVAILDVAGEPLSIDHLYARVGENKNFRGFKGQVQGDPRIRRRGLRQYGLEAWGGEEYTTIVDEMTEELERQGGSMPLSSLARTLAENFGVSESSVRMYADGPQFDIDVDGCVRRRMGDLPTPPSAPLEMTRCCYRLKDGWAYRRRVDHDVLRGSGGGLPIPFAKHIGVTPGSALRFESPYGTVRCSWPSHLAHIGSLRRVAEALGACDGDLLFIVHVAAESFDVRLVTRQSYEAAGGFERLCLECGQEASTDPMSSVAEAIGLDPMQPNLIPAIRLRLGERGERDLASMVPADTGDDDVLDLLASLGE